jgi:sugar fermentation stimulation protein A
MAIKRNCTIFKDCLHRPKEMSARLKIEGEMVRARFLSRTSRFSVLAELAEEAGEAGNFECHLPNPGRLKELLVPGAELLLRPAKDPDRRKTKFDVFAVKAEGGTMVVVDSRIPNQVMRKALGSGEVPQFSGYSLVKSEPAYGKSRLDFLLAGDRSCLVEVKSCTLVRDGIALFPDAPTERGRRHLSELARAHEEGYRASVVFVIQREDAVVFMPNDETDPDFGTALRKVAAKGVEPIAFAAGYREGSVKLIGEVPVDLSEPK